MTIDATLRRLVTADLDRHAKWRTSRKQPRRGRTLQQIARETGLSYCSVHRWFHGDGKPNLDSIQKLADLYQLELRRRKTVT